MTGRPGRRPEQAPARGTSVPYDPAPWLADPEIRTAYAKDMQRYDRLFRARGASRMSFRRGQRVTVKKLDTLSGAYPYTEHWIAYPVKILAIADGYAMVRRPRAAPFVVSVKDLEKWNPPGSTPVEEP